MGEAKILVEVELDKGFPDRIAARDRKGIVSLVDVEYAWIPSKCERCGQIGHKVKRCLLQHQASDVTLSRDDAINATATATSADETVETPLKPMSLTWLCLQTRMIPSLFMILWSLLQPILKPLLMLLWQLNMLKLLKLLIHILLYLL